MPPPPHDHLRGTTTSIGCVDPELIDRSQLAGRSRPACRELREVDHGDSQRGSAAVDVGGSWGLDLQLIASIFAAEGSGAKCVFAMCRDWSACFNFYSRSFRSAARYVSITRISVSVAGITSGRSSRTSHAGGLAT